MISVSQKKSSDIHIGYIYFEPIIRVKNYFQKYKGKTEILF